jgi:hypothetical protein
MSVKKNKDLLESSVEMQTGISAKNFKKNFKEFGYIFFINHRCSYHGRSFSLDVNDIA